MQKEQEYSREYHLRKIIGLNNDIQIHINALRKLGVDIFDTDRTILVRSGIEKFKIPLRASEKWVEFNYYGTEIFQQLKEGKGNEF